MRTVLELEKEGIRKSEIDKLSKNPTWIRVIKPSEDDIEKISKLTDLTLDELQETKEEEERPKVTKDKYLEIIYRAPYIEDGEIITLPFYIYIVKNIIITVEKKPLAIINKIQEGMENKKRKFLFKKGLPYFIFYLLDKFNDDFLLKIDKIASTIDIYEQVTTKTLSTKEIEKIYEQSVTLSFFNQALIANLEVLNTLRKSYFKEIRPKDRQLFEELYYDALQILDTEKIQREAMANLFNLQSIISSTRLNLFMKKLTAIAIVIAVPTLISGIYGMNFKYIPLANHPYGFYIITGVMIVISTLLLIWINKSDEN